MIGIKSNPNALAFVSQPTIFLNGRMVRRKYAGAKPKTTKRKANSNTRKCGDTFEIPLIIKNAKIKLPSNIKRRFLSNMKFRILLNRLVIF